jgi:hypothetical protein
MYCNANKYIDAKQATFNKMESIQNFNRLNLTIETPPRIAAPTAECPKAPMKQKQHTTSAFDVNCSRRLVFPQSAAAPCR